MPADKREPGGRRFDPSTVGTVLVIPHEATSLEGSGRALAAGAEPLREAFSPASAEAVRLPRPRPFRPTELAKAKPAKPQAALGTRRRCAFLQAWSEARDGGLPGRLPTRVGHSRWRTQDSRS